MNEEKVVSEGKKSKTKKKCGEMCSFFKKLCGKKGKGKVNVGGYDKKIVVMMVSAVVFLVCVFGGFAVWAYTHPVDLGPVNFVVKAIPYPAAISNGQIIKLSDWQVEYSAWKKASEMQGSPISEEQIRVDVLSKMIYDRVLRNMAKDYDVEVTPEDVEAELNGIAGAEFESREAMEAEMLAVFGWDIETFSKRLIYPSVMAQKINLEYSKKPEILKEAEEEANDILEKINQGEDFATLAQNFSADTGSAVQGGDLGWFSRGAMVKEFEDASFSLQPGEVSGLVKTTYGYHIIKVEEVKALEEVDEESGEVEVIDQVRARHILISPKLFRDLLNEEVKDANVWTWVDIDKSLMK